MILKCVNFIFFISLFIVASFIQAVNVNKLIEQIPLEDRENLERLFYQLIDDDHFGYTLFGDKPVSIGSYFKVTPWENYIELGQCDGVFWKNWGIWEKYKNQFDIKKYLIIKEESDFVYEVVIINKNEFIKTISTHLNIFENILKKEINPILFLSEIEQGKISFSNSIQNNIVLLGICLGYGKNNSLFFSQKNKILNRNSLELCGDYNNSPLRIQSTYFMANHNNSETKTLQEKYKRLRGKISAIYAQGNFLEITLTQLTSD